MTGDPAILYRGKRYPVKVGEDVLSQLLLAGADIQYLCMGGSCGTCRVTVVRGGEHVDPMDPGERYHIKGDGPQRLACQMICRATGDVEITQRGRGEPLI